jgi:hypothetical protein
MYEFRKYLDLGNFRALFVFSTIRKADSLRLHVTVKDPAGNPCSFEMQKVEEDWKIIDAPKVPDWIMNNQSSLERLIDEEYKRF